MKIGMICYPTFGGSGIIATELGLKLMERGHEVHFISYQLPERLKTEKDFIFHEVNVLSYPLFKYKPYTLVLASLLSKLFREEGIEIMHAHYAIPHSASLYLAKSIDNRMKIITTLHGTDVHLLGLSDAYKPVLEMCLNNHDALTTVSNFMKNFITKNYDIRKNIEVIYNFVDPEKFRPTDKEDKDELVLCHVSNFRKVKRSPDVIRAFAKVYEKHKNIRLEMIGEGPELEYCEDLAICLGLKDKVVFRGSLLNVPKVLNYTDIFLMPSEIEGFGLAALEAMAHNIPVIASNAGGLPEVVEHGKTGFLITPGDVNAMAKYITMLIEDDALRKKLGAEAGRVAREKFHPDKIVSLYEALYERVLHEGN
ncbi:MAG: N-acetyl-alpha-D-glucosaminyl L-malate synthase BshA [Candidatus Asgardarchaeia archaeon]